MNYASERGIAPLVLILMIAAAVVIGIFLILPSKDMPPAKLPVTGPPASTSVENASATDTVVRFSGQVLAGLSAPLLVYTDADYQLAIKANKKILVHFCSNWDPLCKAEFLKMQSAFNEMRTDRVVGFYVHFNDNETGAVEQRLASRLGVRVQNTKVIIENGQRVSISIESWDKARYLDEVNKVLQ